MAFKIKEILLGDGDFVNYQVVSDKKDRLSSLSKINVFIGENNSGKSRFLRELFKQDFNFLPNNFDFEKLISITEKYLNRFENKGNISLNDGALLQFSLILSPIKDKLLQFRDIEPIIGWKRILATNIELFETLAFKSLYTLPQHNRIDIEKDVDNWKRELNRDAVSIDSYQLEKVYIPVLRGLRKFDSDIYHDRILRDHVYQRNSNGDYVSIPLPHNAIIFTGLALYENIKQHLLGEHNKRKLIAEFEEFLSYNFFQGKQITLIPRIDKGNDVVFVKIGNEEERAIYNLGDGIQQIIIMTFQMFMNKGKNMLFYIEEPELYLHPGMQRIFLDTIATHEGFENFQYFIATHSNHFLDITLDTDQISVYTFKKTKEVDENGNPFFNIENVNNDDTRTLELIGVRNSSVFLSNCTIWVEGITDRMYLRKYLELYQNHESEKAKKENKSFRVFKEDLHYSFVEYGGGNITHWSFLGEQDNQNIPTIDYKKITNKIFLVSDKDTGKEERHEELRNHLGDAKINKQGRYYCLDCREIENLLMPHVLQKVIDIYEKNKGNTDVSFSFNYDEYKNEYLGSFIDDKLTNKKVKSYKDGSSGTIKDKPKFAKRAIDSLQDYSDLSEEAQKLTEKIYNFITSHNNNG